MTEIPGWLSTEIRSIFLMSTKVWLIMLIVVHYCYRFLCTVVTDSCALLLLFSVHSIYHFLCTRDFCLHASNMAFSVILILAWMSAMDRNGGIISTFKEDSKILLTDWFVAIYLLASDKKGTSSIKIASYLGIVSIKAR